ncbi:unnamed protein product [Merluccius merluccius]
MCKPRQQPSCQRDRGGVRANDGEAVFIREFSLIRRDHLPEDFLQDTHAPQKPEDPECGGTVGSVASGAQQLIRTADA